MYLLTVSKNSNIEIQNGIHCSRLLFISKMTCMQNTLVIIQVPIDYNYLIKMAITYVLR